MSVTICTVVTPMHKEMIGLNHQLIKSLNPKLSPAWNVVYNEGLHINRSLQRELIRKLGTKDQRSKDWPKTCAEQDDMHALLEAEIARMSESGEVTDYIPEACVLKGYTSKELLEDFENYFGQFSYGDNTYVEKYLGSYLHALGLNTALTNSKTRYSIIIDPDFYIIQKNWIKRILVKMEEEDLSVFGVPWNPRWYQKYRDYPCAHFMVIDHEKLPYASNILAPKLLEKGPKFVSKKIAELANFRDPVNFEKKRNGFTRLFLENLLSLPRADLRQRRTIGASYDTGYTLAEYLKRNTQIKFATAKPVFDPRIEGFQPSVVFPLQRWSLVEKFYPRHLRYCPPPEACRSTGFAESGLPNFRAMNWEEFFLENEPFAFHVRGEFQRRKEIGIDMEPLWNGLREIMERKGLAPPKWTRFQKADEKDYQINGFGS